MKALALIIISMMLVGSVGASSIYFQDTFDSVNGWEVAHGEGVAVDGGTFRGEDTWFLKKIDHLYIYELYYEIVVTELNGSWGLSFTTIEDTRAILYENVEDVGTFAGQMLNAVNIDGIIVEVKGEVTFGSMMIFSKQDHGNPLGDWADRIDEFMDTNIWIAPFGLSLIILMVGVALIFGKKRR